MCIYLRIYRATIFKNMLETVGGEWTKRFVACTIRFTSASRIQVEGGIRQRIRRIDARCWCMSRIIVEIRVNRSVRTDRRSALNRKSSYYSMEVYTLISLIERRGKCLGIESVRCFAFGLHQRASLHPIEFAVRINVGKHEELLGWSAGVNEP
jgi:hypothetical protein